MPETAGLRRADPQAPRQGERRFGATEMEAREGIGAVMGDLTSDGVSQEHRGVVEITLAEVVNNIVKHAYGGAATGDIQVEYDVSEGELVMTITDRGMGFRGGILPAGNPADVSVPKAELPEGGFGWFLIRELTSELDYERRGGYNRLGLRFDLTGDA